MFNKSIVAEAAFNAMGQAEWGQRAKRVEWKYGGERKKVKGRKMYEARKVGGRVHCTVFVFPSADPFFRITMAEAKRAIGELLFKTTSAVEVGE